nr:MAG TPA: hypothetical protein [Caudoviricetes sp.]
MTKETANLKKCNHSKKMQPFDIRFVALTHSFLCLFSALQRNGNPFFRCFFS